MQAFHTIREAKEFLVGRVVAEAQRTGISLPDVEQKMMYFSETSGTLLDMDSISSTFDAECNQSEYEEKVAGLIRSLRTYDHGHDSEAIRDWDVAEKLLRKEDHYLLVLIDLANGKVAAIGNSAPYGSANRMGQLVLYGFIGFLICFIGLAVVMFLFR